MEILAFKGASSIFDSLINCFLYLDTVRKLVLHTSGGEAVNLQKHQDQSEKLQSFRL